MDMTTVILAVLCGIFATITIILSSVLFVRFVKVRRRGRYTYATSRSSAIHMDKVIFSSEDIVWAMDAHNRSEAQNRTTLDSPMRNGTSSLHTLSLQPLSRTSSKPMTNGALNSKMLHKMSVLNNRKVEKSNYTMISSTMSFDQKTVQQNIAYLNGRRQVFCSFVTSNQTKVQNYRKKSAYLKEIRGLTHENVNMFWGVFSDPYKQGFLYDFTKRGSLYDVLRQTENKIALDWSFKQALIRDLVAGMRYIHRSSLKCHGNLKSTKCLIDHRWVLKISGFGLSPLVEPDSVHERPEAWLWTAPEHLRDSKLPMTQKGDVYSFGIILQEVYTETDPFGTVNLSAAEIIRKLIKPPPFCRPAVSAGLVPPPFIHLMKECWTEQSDRRPSFDDIARKIRHMNHGQKTNIIDSILKKLEKYATHLEEIVKERTLELEEEKGKTEQLLCRMLPTSVADDLKAGYPVHPEHYDEVTIFFSDIVGFTTISAASSPIQIVNLLNTLYTRFDEIIGHHDVYKVETIGDAYMCVSGLPMRNGQKHAGEIATMALELLSAITEMKVPHLQMIPLKLRIGCHSGHCAAGVVGLTMPRYCLFGDSVNTASRMESHSRADRIHMSRETKMLLDALGGYHIKDRGLTEIKGKGRMNTYWLVGKDGYTKKLPKFSDDPEEDENHGLESLLTDDELNQLMREVSRNASPKHSRVEEPLQLPAVCNSPMLTVPTRSITPNTVQGRVSSPRSHSIAGSQLRARAHSGSACSGDSRALSADAGQTVHRVNVLPINNDEGRVRRSGSVPTKPSSSSSNISSRGSSNRRLKIHTISSDT